MYCCLKSLVTTLQCLIYNVREDLKRFPSELFRLILLLLCNFVARCTKYYNTMQCLNLQDDTRTFGTVYQSLQKEVKILQYQSLTNNIYKTPCYVIMYVGKYKLYNKVHYLTMSMFQPLSKTFFPQMVSSTKHLTLRYSLLLSPSVLRTTNVASLVFILDWGEGLQTDRQSLSVLICPHSRTVASTRIYSCKYS